MNLKEREDLILGCLQYSSEKYVKIPGIKISKIKDIFLKAHDALILDSDIKELFQKRYVEYYDLQNMNANNYVHGLDGKIKIATQGIDYLKNEKEFKKITLKLSQLI